MLLALLLEAVAAVHRLAAVRSEGDLGLAAAARARGAEHLAGTAVIAATTARIAAATAARVPTTATGVAARGLPAARQLGHRRGS